MIDGEQRWHLATTALSLLAIDPSLKGLLIATPHGPVQQAFSSLLGKQFPLTTIPVSVSGERLSGGLDISQTLSSGKPVYQPGLLARKEGALVVNGAERLDGATRATLCQHLDNPEAPATVLVVIDESLEDEPGLSDSALADRLAMMIELPSLALATLNSLLKTASLESPTGGCVPGEVIIDDDILKQLTLLAQRLGVDSLRSLLFAVRLTRAHAALHGRHEAITEDAAIAAQLVLAPRATTMGSEEPPAEDESQENDEPVDQDSVNQDSADQQEPESPPPRQDETLQENNQPNDGEDLGERLLEAAAATLPQNIIADLARGQTNSKTAGRDAGAAGKGRTGRPTGVRRPRGSIHGQRLNLLETLKAAAPKQKMRGNFGLAGERLQVRLEDFRVTRYKQPTRTTTVFVVDASGSAALHRLAEAKGAVLLLLAECYVRRDRVAMISFRGTEAQLDLPPTRSLVRAKRELANLPGGGGTPLAAGLDLTTQVVRQLRQAGETPVVIIMTDGKANIARDGSASRQQATDDALAAARQLASTQVKCLFVDTAPRARPQAREMAEALRARYLPLPAVSVQTLPELVRA